MAMLGVLHRAVLGQGPAHFQNWFFLASGPTHNYPTTYHATKHSRQLRNYLDGFRSELLRWSALGLTRTYNNLAHDTVQAKTVTAFQRKVQETLKKVAEADEPNWAKRFNSRKDRV